MQTAIRVLVSGGEGLDRQIFAGVLHRRIGGGVAVQGDHEVQTPMEVHESAQVISDAYFRQRISSDVKIVPRHTPAEIVINVEEIKIEGGNRTLDIPRAVDVTVKHYRLDQPAVSS